MTDQRLEKGCDYLWQLEATLEDLELSGFKKGAVYEIPLINRWLVKKQENKQ